MRVGSDFTGRDHARPARGSKLRCRAQAPASRMITLSVITPVRNQARYLGETLDTVAALGVPHEHVVIDGASDDGTVELLERRGDPNLSWVSEPDEGQTDAVNKGFARA